MRKCKARGQNTVASKDSLQQDIRQESWADVKPETRTDVFIIISLSLCNVLIRPFSLSQPHSPPERPSQPVDNRFQAFAPVSDPYSVPVPWA